MQLIQTNLHDELSNFPPCNSPPSVHLVSGATLQVLRRASLRVFRLSRVYLELKGQKLQLKKLNRVL